MKRGKDEGRKNEGSRYERKEGRKEWRDGGRKDEKKLKKYYYFSRRT